MGFPLGLEDLYTDFGFVNTDYVGSCDFDTAYGCIGLDYDFAVDNDTDTGSSGGPVFDIQLGKVVGVIVAGTVNENSNKSWVRRAEHLNDFWKPEPSR